MYIRDTYIYRVRSNRAGNATAQWERYCEDVDLLDRFMGIPWCVPSGVKGFPLFSLLADLNLRFLVTSAVQFQRVKIWKESLIKSAVSTRDSTQLEDKFGKSTSLLAKLWSVKLYTLLI